MTAPQQRTHVKHEPTLKSWKLVVLFLGAVFHIHVLFVNAHLCAFMSVLYYNVCISELNYDLVDLNTTMWGVQQGCCLTLTCQIRLNLTLVLCSKTNTALPSCAWKQVINTAKHAATSATLLRPNRSRSHLSVCVFSRLLKKHVKLLIFIKYAFLKPTPTFLPAEV